MAVNEHDERGIASADARIARLYRQAAAEEPPARLDAAIAAAARERRAAPARRKPPAWWTLWRLPFAVAAVAIVSVSLVTLMMEEGGERLTAPEPAPPVVTHPQVGQPGSKARDAAAPERALAPAPRRSRPSEAAPAGAPEVQGAARSELETERVPASPPPAQEREAVAAEPGASASQSPAPRAEAKKLREQAAAAEDRAPAAPAAARGRMESDAARPLARRTADIERLVAELDLEPPARWIERVLMLRSEGRRSEADALLAELKRRFPKEPLPAELH